MFDIYLEKYFDSESGTVKNGPTKALSIPVDDPSDIWMTSPAFKTEVGKAESFSFSVNPGSKYYNAFLQYKTRVRIDYDGTIICYARVTTVNTSSMLQIRAIQCEGVYSTLKDTPIEGKEEELQKKITATTLLNNVITEHNLRADSDEWKKMRLNNDHPLVIDPGLETGESKKMAPNSWSDSLSVIDSILGKYGGYIRVVYELENNKVISSLQWKKDFYRDLGDNKRPHIQVAKNLIDFSSSDEIGELFTRIIPIGQKTTTTKSKESRFVYLSSRKYFKVSDVCGLYTDEQLNSGFHRKSDYENAEANYGVIYKTMSFQNADTAAKLETYVKDWVKRNYYGILRTFTVKAIDMHMVGDGDPKILAGDCVDFTYPEYDSNGNTVLITRKLLCKAVSYNLFNPDQSSYTLGIPSDLLDFEYGEKKKTKKASSTSANNGSVGGGGGKETRVVDFDSVKRYLRWFYYSAPWVTYNTSIENHAYSWRCDGLTSYTDEQPYKNARDYRTITVTYGDFEETDSATYSRLPDNEYKKQERYTDSDGFERVRYYYRPKQEEVSYSTAAFHYEDKNIGECRIICHYRTSPCAKIFTNPDAAGALSKLPAFMKTSHHYGVGVKEGTLDIFAFDWADYRINGPSIEIKFYFPDYSGGEYKSSFDGGSSSSSETPSAPTAEPTVDSETGEEIYIDEHGNPVSSFNPNTGGIKFIDFHDNANWEYDDGTPAEPNAEGAHPRPVYDDDGNPLWSMALNEPIKMLNPKFNPELPISTDNPKYITIGGDGYITTKDLALPGIPSFQTEVAVVHDLIAQRATIGELRAYTAIIGSGEPTPITDAQGNVTGYTVDGTQFETNANAMNAVAGVFETDTEGHLITDDEGNAVIKEGGGLSVRKNGAALGYYNSGNLTGGLMVKKINNQTQTTIRGDKVNLEVGVDEEGNPTGSITLTDILAIRSAGESSRSISVHGDSFFSGDIYLSSGYNTSGRTWDGKISARYVEISSDGKILFPDAEDYNPNSTATYLDQSRVQELLGLRTHTADNKSHIKIVDGDTPNTYKLLYLPACLDPDSASESDWIDSGNFSKAASGGALTATWSSGAFPLTFSNGSGTPSKSVGFIVPNSGATYDYPLEIGVNVDSSAGYVYSVDPIVPYTISVPLAVTQWNGQNTPSTVRYRKNQTIAVGGLLQDSRTVSSNGLVTPGSAYVGLKAVNVNVVPTLDYAFSGSGIQSTSNPNPARSITITSNPISNSPIKIGFGAVNDADIHLGVTLGTSSPTNNGTSLAIPVNVIRQYDDGTPISTEYSYSITHNCSTIYNNGKTDEKKLIYARFAHDSEDGYYIEPYEGSTAHAAGLSNGMLKYKLGVNGNVVQIQTLSGTKIDDTPTYTIPEGGSSIAPTFEWPTAPLPASGSNATNAAEFEIRARTSSTAVTSAYLSLDQGVYKNAGNNNRYCVVVYNQTGRTGDIIGRANINPSLVFRGSSDSDSRNAYIHFDRLTGTDYDFDEYKYAFNLSNTGGYMYLKNGTTQLLKKQITGESFHPEFEQVASIDWAHTASNAQSQFKSGATPVYGADSGGRVSKGYAYKFKISGANIETRTFYFIVAS